MWRARADVSVISLTPAPVVTARSPQRSSGSRSTERSHQADGPDENVDDAEDLRAGDAAVEERDATRRDHESPDDDDQSPSQCSSDHDVSSCPVVTEGRKAFQSRSAGILPAGR